MFLFIMFVSLSSTKRPRRGLEPVRCHVSHYLLLLLYTLKDKYSLSACCHHPYLFHHNRSPGLEFSTTRSGQMAKMVVEEEDTVDLIAGAGGMKFEKHKGFWFRKIYMPGVRALQMEFKPRPDDIYLASPMKSGTTWIKALVNSLLAVKLGEEDAQTLKNPPASVDEKNPHDLVPTIEMHLFFHINQQDLSVFSGLPSPRLLHTHLPFDLLHPLVKSGLSDCKIVYVARNPRDVFVSYWKFYNKIHENDSSYLSGDLSKEEVFDVFCSGHFHGGPFAESVLSYWRESRRNPNRVMFLTYEELQADCVGCVKRLGAFLGFSPPLLEEHAQRIVDKCSFDSLSSLQVNKTGNLENFPSLLSNSLFFREGKVGEWKKYFTAEMEERIRREIEQKFNNESLLFTYE